MPRWGENDADWDDESDVDDEDEDDEEPTIACPYCRRDIHEDAQQCPYCHSFISREDAPVRKPWWLLLGVGVCLYVVYRWIVPW